jgi:hypothetical protein
MAFWMTLLIWVFTAVLGELLRPRVSQNAPKPAQLSDFQVPTATEDRSIPVIWGTVEIAGANVIWYGDLVTQPIEKSVQDGLFSSNKVTTGYRYFLGQQFALCRGPIDALLGIRLDSYVTWEGGVQSGSFTVDQAGLFGGEEREGGFKAVIDVVPGDRAQVANPYVASLMNDVPGYRGVCCVVFRGPSAGVTISGSPSGYVGTQPYLKQPKFTVRRVTIPADQPRLNSGKADIAGDMNPAEILWELLTNNSWGGMGLPPQLVDTASFLYAADVLYSEGFGLSLMWDQAGQIEDKVAEVLRHIDGVLYPDPATGLFTLILARGDYDAATLPNFDESTIAEVTNYSVSSWDETTNEVRASYLERRYFKVKGTLSVPPTNPQVGDQWLVGADPTGAWANHAGELARWGGASWAFAPAGGYQDGAPAAQYVFTSRVAAAQDLGNYQIQQQLVSGSVSYPGISNATLAQRCAQRDLRTLTYPLVRCTVRFNRSAYNLRPGKVFKIDWPELGLQGLVLRVLKISFGTLEQGAISCECIEDIFSLADLTYTPPPATTTTTPPVATLPQAFTPTDAAIEAGEQAQAAQQTADQALAAADAANAVSIQGVPVAPTQPANGQALVYNSVSGRYEPAAAGAGGAAASQVTVTPTGALQASNVQAALAELDSDLTAEVTARANADALRVLKSGDTMSGPLTLPGDPTQPLHAATKQYVDSKGISTITAQVTTASIAPGARLNATVVLARSFKLLKVQADNPCRVRVYGSAAARTADATRPSASRPTPGSGVFAQVAPGVSGAPLTINLSPIPNIASGETPVTATVPISIENVGASALAFTLIFTAEVSVT